MDSKPPTEVVRKALEDAVSTGTYSVAELAAIAGVSPQALHAFRNGEGIRSGLLDKLADQLGVVAIQDRMKYSARLRERK